MWFKEGNTQKQKHTHTHTHTKRDRANGAEGPAAANALSFSFGFFHKSQKILTAYTRPKICNGKTKGLAIVYANKLLLDIFYKALAPQNA